MKWLIHKIPVELILYLYHHQRFENYALKITKEIDSTYSHITILTSKLEEIGLIKKSLLNDNRTINLELTNKGKNIAKNLDEIKGVLGWG